MQSEKILTEAGNCMDKLKKLGYTDYFHEFAESAEFKGCHPARVIAEHRGLYIVNSGSGELSAKVTGNMIFSASSREDYPAVGDFVLIETVDNEHAAIKGVMPRRTILKRKMVGKEFDMQIIATNIDTAFIIQAPDRDYNLNRIERYMALARSGEIETAIILNKTDIADRLDLENKMNELKERFPGTAIYGTSFVTGEGIEKLSADIKSAHTYCFIGSSGVGKSSIINMLLGNKVMKTGEKSVERGKHVTTHRHLFILANGGLLIDTPGMREIAPLESEVGIGNVFFGINEFAFECRFADCTHTHEPGCAIIKRVKTGEINQKRYENYLKLKKEDRYNTMSNVEKRKTEKDFGKFLKNYNKYNKKEKNR